MTKDPGAGDRIHAVVTGPVQGQLAIGKEIGQHQEAGAMSIGLTDADRAELSAVFAKLGDDVAASVPESERTAALERVDELHEAIATDDPDLTTVHYVKQWFARKLPGAAGLVASVLVHPLVGAIVQRAGEKLADSMM